MSKIPYTPPTVKNAFNCPRCKAYAKQEWGRAMSEGHQIHNANFTKCTHCNGYAFWIDMQLVYPAILPAPEPNTGLPPDVLSDFNEAREIAARSPRGAAALLRLCIQKLCIQVGKPGKDLNADIGSLVKDGLDQRIQKALDIVRVVGNEAVHPGKLNIKDDKETVEHLFELVNLITEELISKPAHLSKLYSRLIPESKKEAIRKRDTEK